jgi:hypothetical protein
MPEDLLAIISRLRWQLAKTMPELPHEWTHRRDAGDDRDFVLLFEAILRDGAIEWWRGKSGRYRKGRYLYLDGWRYWTLSSDPDHRGIINRHTLAEAVRLRAAGAIRD